LTKYVLEQGKAAGIPVPALEGFEHVMAQATGGDIARAAQAAEAFVARNERTVAPSNADTRPGAKPEAVAAARMAPSPEGSTPPARTDTSAPTRPDASAPLKGYVMEQRDIAKAALAPAAGQTRQGQQGTVAISVAVLALLLGWRRHRSSQLFTNSANLRPRD
jgi:hypothetical protein